MLTKRNWLVIGIAAVLLIGIGVAIISCISEPKNSELVLSDYPELFKTDTLIVVGGNASQVENEAAEAIGAELEELSGNEPIIKNDSQISQSNKSDYNLILVGTPHSNNLLQEVYDVTNTTKVTEEYPGENKGILEILRNPWDEEKAILLVAGSDEWGVKAGSELLTEGDKIKQVEDRIKETGLRVGGDCIYSHYSGVCVVTKIEKTERSMKQAKTRGGYEGYEVWFVFETDQEVKKEWARKAINKEQLLRVPGSPYPYPGLEYLEQHQIEVGGKYPCTLKVIKSGTCTPIIFEFD